MSGPITGFAGLTVLGDATVVGDVIVTGVVYSNGAALVPGGGIPNDLIVTSSLLVSGPITGFNGLTVSGYINGSKVVCPSLFHNISTGTIGFFGQNPQTILAVTSDAAYSLSGILEALSSYGLITLGNPPSPPVPPS